MDVLDCGCTEFVRLLRKQWYEKREKGSPIEGSLWVDRRSLGNDVNYDYFPIELEQIDSILEQAEEWVSLCQDEDKYGNIDYQWKSSFFPYFIVYSTLIIEGRQGIRIDDIEEQHRYVDTFISGEIGNIELLSEDDPHGLYGELSKLVYYCWMPLFARAYFNDDKFRDFERVLYRVVIQLSNFLGRSGYSRSEVSNKTRKIAKLPRYGETTLKMKIKEEWKKCQKENKNQRDISSFIANKLGTSYKHVRHTVRKAGLVKTPPKK